MSGLRMQRKIVTRQSYLERLALRERVHEPRAASRIRLELDRDSVGAVGIGRVDERVLPDQFAEIYIDMSAGLEGLQRPAVGTDKLDRPDICSFDANPSDKGILCDQFMPFSLRPQVRPPGLS